MEKKHLGTCHLPMDVIIEYMESLAQSYTEEVRLVQLFDVEGTLLTISGPVLRFIPSQLQQFHS